MFKRQIVPILSVLCLCSLSAARASTIDQHTTGPSTGGTGFYGQNFITPAGNPFDNIVFTFLTTGGANFATGTGFLLSSQYLGTPAALSNATPGFLGLAAASGNLYTFSPSLTLAPATTYWFYENASIASGTIFGGDVYAGHQFYFSSSSGSPFANQTPSALNFRVTGNLVPEPSTYALLSAGLASLFGVARIKSRGKIR